MPVVRRYSGAEWNQVLKCHCDKNFKPNSVAKLANISEYCTCVHTTAGGKNVGRPTRFSAVEIFVR
jgi:hypothetical protein